MSDFGAITTPADVWCENSSLRHRMWGHGLASYNHRCPFPMGWLIHRGVCSPFEQRVNDGDDGIRVTGPSFFTKRTRLGWILYWLVLWNICSFSIYWEESSQLTFIFFRGVGIPPTSIVINNHPHIRRNMIRVHLQDERSLISLQGLRHKYTITVCGIYHYYKNTIIIPLPLLLEYTLPTR